MGAGPDELCHTAARLIDIDVDQLTADFCDIEFIYTALIGAPGTFPNASRGFFSVTPPTRGSSPGDEVA